jgi:hypothetical protein
MAGTMRALVNNMVQGVTKGLRRSSCWSASVTVRRPRAMR